jgi:hypothetical protein
MIAQKTTDDLVRIVSYGGGLDFIASGKTTDDLVRIASYAQSGGAHVTMRGMGKKSTDDLVRIGSYGKGHVTFAD